MTLLQDFPLINQNATITEDGLPNKDAPFECVATSILAGVMWLNGVHQLGGKYTPDYFKDSAYGEAYMGGTSAARYIDLCTQFGVKLWAFNGMPGVLVEEAHTQLQAGHPVVFTEPDPYVSASLGWTHVCVFYGEEQGWLTALDPYIGKPLRRTDSEWIQLLQFQQIWIIEKEKEEEPIKTIELTDPMVGRYYELGNSDGTAWRCRSNGKIVQGAILQAYKTGGRGALCGLTDLGLPESNAIPLPGIPDGAVKQYFERGTLIEDPSHKNDNPPGSDGVYAAHLYEGPAQDPRVAQLTAQLAQLQAQSGNSADAADAAKLAQIKAIVS